MHFSFLTHDQMLNIGTWMIFLAIILLLILIPLAIVEKVVQRRSEKQCTATANGAYAGTKVVGSQRRSHNNKGNPAPLVYEQVRFNVNGEDIVVSPRLTHGVTSKTEVGAPLVIHYDPDNPLYCWAHTPMADVGVSIWVKVFAWCAVIAFVLGQLLIRFA